MIASYTLCTLLTLRKLALNNSPSRSVTYIVGTISWQHCSPIFPLTTILPLRSPVPSCCSPIFSTNSTFEFRKFMCVVTILLFSHVTDHFLPYNTEPAQLVSTGYYFRCEVVAKFLGTVITLGWTKNSHFVDGPIYQLHLTIP
jgi:hypothetical protein